jgi:hypothetical protein
VPEQVYELGGFGAREPLVFEVTDWLHPVRLLDPTPAAGAGIPADRAGSRGSAAGEPGAAEAATRWRVRHGRGAGERAHYLAVSDPVAVESADLELRRLGPLRQRTSGPDMLIVAHETLLEPATRLAAHRRSHFPDLQDADILVVSTADVYDHFSGGRLDPLAIRNCAKFLYNLDPGEPRLRYLLLFGDATRDPRQNAPDSPPTLVPTVHPWYADPGTRREYAVDGWLAEMETPANSTLPQRVAPMPDLAVGRVTARNAAEAAAIVDKIIAYDASADYGAWRARVVLASDDECAPPAACAEPFYIHNAETVAELVPGEYDVEKIYLTEFPKVLGQKPASRDMPLPSSWPTRSSSSPPTCRC